MSARRALAGIAALGGVLATFAGSPYRTQHVVVDVERLAAAVAHEEDHVTAIELAAWIRDRKPGLRVVDLRPASDFDALHIPGAERVAMESLASTRFGGTDTLVLVSEGGAHAAQAWVFMQALGYRHVFFLRGGMQEWLDEVMNPTHPSALSRYFGGVPRPGGAKPATAADVRRRGC